MKSPDDLDPREDFPEWLRRARTQLRLSQKRLGEHIDAFGGEISWWEAGKSRPSREQLRRIYDFFEVEDDPDPGALPVGTDDDLASVDDAAGPVTRSASASNLDTDVGPSEDDADEDDADEDETDDADAGLAAAPPEGGSVVRGSRHPLALPMPSREELCRLYLEEKVSIKNIGIHYGVSSRTARKWLKRSKIPLRSLSEQMRHSAHRGPLADDAPQRRRRTSSSKPTVRTRRRATPRGDASAASQVDDELQAAPEPPTLERSVRVRRRDDETPRQQRPEYDVDDTGRVYRIDLDDDEDDDLDDTDTLETAADEVTPPPASDDGRPSAADVAAAAAALLGANDETPTVVRRTPSAARNRVGDSRVRVADFADEVLERPRLRQNHRRVRMVSARPTGRIAGPTTPSGMSAPTSSNGASRAPATLAAESAPSDAQPRFEAPVSAPASGNKDPLVVSHVDAGYSVPELALREGLSVREVRERLLDAGIKVRSWRDRLEVKRGTELPPKEALARQLQLGVQLEDLADSYEVSLARVRGWLDHFALIPETGTRVDRFDRIDGASAAVVAIADGAHQVVADTDLAIAMAAYAWALDGAGRPCTRLAGCAIPLSHMVLGIEPGEVDHQVEHANGNLLDCRKANLRRA